MGRQAQASAALIAVADRQASTVRWSMCRRRTRSRPMARLPIATAPTARAPRGYRTEGCHADGGGRYRGGRKTAAFDDFTHDALRISSGAIHCAPHAARTRACVRRRVRPAPSDLGQHAGPVARLRLAEQAQRRVPGAVGPVAHPAPVGVNGSIRKHGLPMAPARWATAVSTLTTTSSSSMIRRVGFEVGRAGVLRRQAAHARPGRDLARPLGGQRAVARRSRARGCRWPRSRRPGRRPCPAGRAPAGSSRASSQQQRQRGAQRPGSRGAEWPPRPRAPAAARPATRTARASGGRQPRVTSIPRAFSTGT